MAKTSKAVKKIGAKTQTGNMQHKDCPCTQGQIMPSRLKPLTQRQKDTLKRHAKHHTKRHMAEMTKSMRQGMTFGAAHKKAMSKVGK